MSFRNVGCVLFLWSLAACQPAQPQAPSEGPAPAPQTFQFKADLIYQDRALPSYPAQVDPGLRAALSVLALQPGMGVLVLGPESGYLTFPIARAVGPTGSVLSSCDFRFNQAWLLDHAPDGGLTNISAAYYPELDLGTLPAGGFQRVVLMDFRSEPPADPSLAARLAPLLAPGGRVVVFHRKEFADFSPRAVWSPLEALRQLCVYGPQFPLRQRFAPSLEALVQGSCEAGADTLDPAFPPAFLAALNGLFDDRTLYRDLTNFFNQTRGFAGELASFFNEDPPLRVLQWYDNAFGYLLLDEREPLTPGGRVAVNTVNHLVLAAIFDLHPQRADRFVDQAMLFSPEGVTRALEGSGLRSLPPADLFSTHHCQVFEKPGVTP
jgi:hypothetical protein